MRVAVTGAGGRLGRALLAALAGPRFAASGGPLAWSRPDYDLDDPSAAARLVERDRPRVVVHAAAWTDVDGCARDPRLAMRRNALAVAELAEACVAAGVDLVLVSTNEVFDGLRTDGRPYSVADRPAPGNPYGASKLAGENSAQAAFVRRGGAVTAEPGAADGRPQLAIVRSSWLFGPPGNDFPSKILAAAERARAAGRPLRVVGDETGSPTYARDLAQAIANLLATGTFAGVHHVVNGGMVSRAGWARVVLAAAGLEVAIEEIPLADWQRPSVAPAWAVLEPTPLPSGEPLRPWEDAFADYLPALISTRFAGAPR
jgi:dTDP-4-dehydrorhamnose reductase